MSATTIIPNTDADVRSAAAHASTAGPPAGPADTAGAVLERLRGNVFDTADSVAVCTGKGVLAGTVSMERLPAAAPGARPETFMDADPPTVAEGADRERAAARAVQHGETALAWSTATAGSTGSSRRSGCWSGWPARCSRPWS